MKIHCIALVIFIITCIGSAVTMESSGEIPELITNNTSDLSTDADVMNDYSPERKDNESFDGKCKYTMDAALVRSNSTLQDQCCSKLFRVFKIYWNHSTIKLGDYLRALKMWECPMFEEECKERNYAFSEYTKHLYDRFCDPKKFESQCGMKVIPFMDDRVQAMFEDDLSSGDGSGNASVEESVSIMAVGWSGIINSNSLKSPLSRTEQEDPCVQAALVNVKNFSAGRYYEVKQSEMAFCDIPWCAFTAETFLKHEITDSDCMPQSCKRSIYIMMGLAGLLGVLITLANLLVLVVFGINRRLMNSQGIYKVSLAAADLLVGLFVFPTFIETMRRSFLTPYKLFESEPYEYSLGSGTNGTRLVVNSYDEAFLGFAGFFTNLSLVVSMYSLMIASFDRLLVVYRPLEYNQFEARKVAKKCVAFLWCLGILYSILPFCVPHDLHYMRVASVLVCVGGGDSALILYAVTTAIPLLLVWIVNIATFCYSKRNAQVRPKVRFPEQTMLSSVNLETRLAKTLSIMVVVFSLCIFPVAAVLISELFIEGIHTSNPDTFHMPSAVTVMSVEAVSAFILMSNSLWNFFIYNVRSQEFRACFLALFRKTTTSCCRTCHDSRDFGSSKFNASSSNAQASRKNITMSTRVRSAPSQPSA